jgi:sugar O-acyltransferase (sialic acid O-acetyltransferase NeuD family)
MGSPGPERSRRTPIFLFGCGGHGRSVFEVIERQGRYRVAAALDDGIAAGGSFREAEVVGGREALAELPQHDVREGFVAIGDNSERERITELALGSGLELVTLIDPGAVIARGVDVGRGTVVMPGVVVNSGARISDHVILNTSCTVDHDCRVGALAHLAPGVHVSGECELGAGSHLGIGSCVRQRVHIGAAARVGAGAAVVDDLPDGSVAVGVPARPVVT